MPPPWRTHGTGYFEPQELGSLGDGVVIEAGVLVFNPAYVHLGNHVYVGHRAMLKGDTRKDRKSTRLNSSHTVISYAVFCLKKKKRKREHHQAGKAHQHALKRAVHRRRTLLQGHTAAKSLAPRARRGIVQ